MRKGLRRTAGEWSEAGASLLAAPGSARYVLPWLRSMRLPHQEAPLACHVPYMPYAVTSWLDGWLQPGMAAFEYGSGGSTLWLAKRVGCLTSVEHDRAWYEAVQDALARHDVANCTLALHEPDPALPAVAGSSAYGSQVIPATFEAYVRAVENVPDESLDLVLIDGRSRSAAVDAARNKVKPGGALVLDDSDRERYQPAQQRLHGWRRKRFRGVKPFVVKPAETTVWLKPEG